MIRIADYLICLLVAISLSGCTLHSTVPWPEKQFSDSSRRQANTDVDSSIEIYSEISSARRSGKIKIINRSERDAFCESINITVIRDSPTSYLEVSENVALINQIYIARLAELENKVEGLFSEHSSDKANHIRAIHGRVDKGVCRSARIDDYCNYASKDPGEVEFLVSLMKLVRASDCDSLEEEINIGNGVIDLRDIAVLRHEPFEYIDKGINYILNDTPEDIAFKEKVLKNNHLNVLPSFHMVPEKCKSVGKIELMFNGDLRELCAMPTI